MLHLYRVWALAMLCLPTILPACSGKSINTVYFPEREFNFGTGNPGDTINHIFFIENRGRDSLFIRGVEAACSCTATEWTRKGIPPGQKGQIMVTLVIRDTGLINKSVVLELNRDSAIYSLFLRGKSTLP